jgi:putative sigma-54 modulation protein
MKVTFTGRQQTLTPQQERKIAIQFGKLAKLLDVRDEKNAQVALSTERHLQIAELRVNLFGQTVVARGAGSDQFNAILESVDKLEKQVRKTKTKFRDTKRQGVKSTVRGVAPVVEAAPPTPAKAKKDATPRPAKVVRATAKTNGKPMTFEEALLEMEEERDYMLYRDADTDQVRVLVRRRDGKVDLIEA